MELSWECCSRDLIFPGLAATASACRQKVSFCLSQVYIPLAHGDKFNPCPRCPWRLISITACEQPKYLKITEQLGVAVIGDIMFSGLCQCLPNEKPPPNWSRSGTWGVTSEGFVQQGEWRGSMENLLHQMGSSIGLYRGIMCMYWSVIQEFISYCRLLLNT